MQNTLHQFSAALATAVSVSNRAHGLDQAGNYQLPIAERELITQACFVRMFVALEGFLESSFAHYGMRRASLQGASVQCYVTPPSEEHLHNMFVGLGRFVDWSSPDKVRELARLYFAGGGPFETPLASAHTDIYDMKTVRNAASHISRTTTAQVDALYRRWTNTPVVGISAYQMLTAAGTQHSGMTFMAYSEAILRGVATQIANHR